MSISVDSMANYRFHPPTIYCPQPFGQYGNVESIIDCFEIEIEKPTKAVKQSISWSEYKKCNTLKYLISGYGGRVSDMILLDSGYLDILPEGVLVMADRGFKHVENAINIRKCSLVRPPSVSAGSQLNEA